MMETCKHCKQPKQPANGYGEYCSEECYKTADAKEITITLTKGEWDEISGEANGHLSYWGEYSEAVAKLDNILMDH